MEEFKIFLFGLDNAGKTTLVSFIKGEPNLETEPTRSFDIVDLILEDTNIHIWDAPGQVAYRISWHKGLDRVKLLIFVLDTSDDVRYEEALGEFNNIVKKLDDSNSPLIFCYNKMDLANSNNINTAKNVFALSEIKDRMVYPVETSIHATETIDKLKKLVVKVIVDSQKEFFKKEEPDKIKLVPLDKDSK